MVLRSRETSLQSFSRSLKYQILEIIDPISTRQCRQVKMQMALTSVEKERNREPSEISHTRLHRPKSFSLARLHLTNQVAYAIFERNPAATREKPEIRTEVINTTTIRCDYMTMRDVIKTGNVAT
jgi:hypothetical protein